MPPSYDVKRRLGDIAHEARTASVFLHRVKLRMKEKNEKNYSVRGEEAAL